jgi:predicted DNA-binding transcriptional regulator YafY
MPVNLDALLRYHTINHCLQQLGKRWTWEELANACADYADEVAYRDSRSIPSKRTIQNDIKVMRSADLGYNAPIKSVGGKYFYEDSTYSIKNITLNHADFETISLAAKVLGQYKGFDFFNEFSSIFQKFESRLQLRFNTQIQQNIAFEELPIAKGTAYLKPLLDSINQQQVQLITYHKFHTEEAKQYIVHPYLLKEYNNRWYVLGYSERHGSIATFALDRIESTVPQANKTFLENQSFDAKSYFSDTIGVTYSGQKPEQVIIRVENEFTPYLLTKPLHHSQQLIEKGTEFCTFSYQLVVNQELENLLMSHANHIVVIEPKHLKEHLKEKLQKAIQYFH